MLLVGSASKNAYIPSKNSGVLRVDASGAKKGYVLATVGEGALSSLILFINRCFKFFNSNNTVKLSFNCPVQYFALNLFIGTSVWRSSRSGFGRSTGINISSHYNKQHYFPFFSHFPPSPWQPFLIEGVHRSKNLFCKGAHLSRPQRPFLSPLAAILDFAGGAAVLGLSVYPLRH